MGKTGRRRSLEDLVGATDIDLLPSDYPDRAPLADFAANPGNPRYGYSDPSVVELAATFQSVGQTQAVEVLPTATFLAHFPQHAEDVPASARWVVMDGNRRLAAAHSIGLPMLRMTVAETLAEVNATTIRESILISNIQRESLPPLLEAAELAVLVRDHGAQQKVAERLGKSQGWVSQRLALLQLSPELQERLRAGDLTVEQARAVARKPVDQQVAALDDRKASTPVATVTPLRPVSSSPHAVPAAIDMAGVPADETVSRPPNAPGGTVPGPAEAVADQGSRPATARVRLGTMEDLAADLRKHLDSEQISALMAVLKRKPLRKGAPRGRG